MADRVSKLGAQSTLTVARKQTPRDGRPCVVDLFCGCGGFALGAHNADLGPSAAFDVDPILTSSVKHNFPGLQLSQADLSTASGADIRRIAGGPPLAVFGGPPCQAFSDIGRRKADDPRRAMLWHFFRLVRELRPSFFVMENVRGLGYAGNRQELDAAMEQVGALYTVLGPLVLDAADFGAATRRRRLFVIGYDAARCDAVSVEDLRSLQQSPATVFDAIGDLGSVVRQGADGDFDLWQLRKPRSVNAYRDRLRAPDRMFTGHQRTTHSPAVVRRFQAIEQGGFDEIGRHPRLSWKGQCPTLRAGTGSDRGSYQSVRPIHPKEPRVITVREAARMQGFPDWFRFHPTTWHSFRMIGNSVSPILAEAIFSLLKAKTDAPKGRTDSSLRASAPPRLGGSPEEVAEAT